jgi:hypothetical protein
MVSYMRRFTCVHKVPEGMVCHLRHPFIALSGLLKLGFSALTL